MSDEVRQLATVQKIKALLPIENADKIVLAEFDSIGWRCIVNKDEFKVGDLAVYCEIDSVLPDVSDYEFLRKRCFVDNGVVKGMRIRTLKLKSQLSQGICFPMNTGALKDSTKKFKEGDDITALMNIIKYESPEAPKQPEQAPKKFWKRMIWRFKKLFPKEKRGRFPNWLPQTDEIRIQNYPDAYKKNKGNVFYITEKLDGSSASYAINKNRFWVMSRTMVRKIDKISKFFSFVKRFAPKVNRTVRNEWVDNGVWERIATEYSLKEKLMLLNRNIAIQGEIVGEGIQKNKYGIKGVKFFCFGAYDIDKQKYLNYDEWKQMMSELNITMVPLITDSYVLSENTTVDELVKMAEGKSVMLDTPREGIVFRLVNDEGRKVSFKAINNEFLLKHGE